MAVFSTEIELPQPAAPRVSLVATANDLSSAAGGRWVAGFVFRKLGCDDDIEPMDSCDTFQMTLPDFDDGVVGPVTPYVVWDGVKCSTFGMVPQEEFDRASLKLALTESDTIAREFWKGTLAQAQGWNNQYLAAGVDVTQLHSGQAFGRRNALAELQQALAECLHGRRGMIHATMRTASLWLGDRLIRREGNLLLDAFDNIIVADSGYDGSAPNGSVDPDLSTAWAYATDMVSVLRTAAEFTTRKMSEVVQVNTNTIEVLAYKFAAVAFNECCLIGVNVNHCQENECPPGGS